MKNNMIEMIRESCTVTAPDILPRLDFAAATEYKDTVATPSPAKSYIKAAVIYAAACLVLAIAIPFIIGNVTDHESTKPGVDVPPVKEESTINAEDINEVYNEVDPDTLPDKVTIEEVEKIIEAVRLAYDDYDVIVLGDGSKITTTPKKPDITEDDLDGMFADDLIYKEYKEYFEKIHTIIIEAITSRFPERSVCVFNAENLNLEKDIYAQYYFGFCVLDIEGSGYASAEKIYDKMMGAGTTVSKYYCDMIWFRKGSESEALMITHEREPDPENSISGMKSMIFPTAEEYKILTEELPESSGEYRLAIENEILAAESVRSKEELIEYGYEETVTYDGAFVRREFECETGEITVDVHHDSGIKMHPFITVDTYGEKTDENGQQKVSVQIWTGFVIIEMELTVELNKSIVLPETAEKELRYILNIEKDRKILDMTDTDLIRTLISDTVNINAEVITLEDVEKLIEKSAELYGNYDTIKLSADEHITTNTVGRDMRLSYVKELTPENYQQDYDNFAEYRTGSYDFLLELMSQAFPDAYFSSSSLASDAYLIFDLESTGYETAGLAVGKLLTKEDVGEVVVATLGCLYHYDCSTEEATRIFPTEEVYQIEKDFYDIIEYGGSVEYLEEKLESAGVTQ